LGFRFRGFGNGSVTYGLLYVSGSVRYRLTRRFNLYFTYGSVRTYVRVRVTVTVTVVTVLSYVYFLLLLYLVRVRFYVSYYYTYDGPATLGWVMLWYGSCSN